jgi:GH35 family endo-1,4-beta-xylanase
MIIKNIVTCLLVSIILVSCAPAAIVVPTETAIPASTITPLLPTSTITPTPAPENIADSKDLPIWVNEFVHAYGGKVTVNGVDIDANQLTDEIRQNSNKFIETKQVNGVEILFLVVNNIPLAIREGNSQWQEATVGKLKDMNGISISLEMGWNDFERQTEVVKKLCNQSCEFILAGNLQPSIVFGEFSDENWTNIIKNWDTMEKQLDNGDVPQGFPYWWSAADDYITAYSSIVKNPQIRGQNLLMNSGDIMIDRLSLDNDQVMKILEYQVKTRVLHYRGIIDSWDLTDEFMASYVSRDPMGAIFWTDHTGLTPAELISTINGWVKTANPEARTYIVDFGMFNYSQPWVSSIRYGNLALLQELSDMNVPIDGYIDENNLSINTGFNEEKAQEDFNYIKSLGFEIGGSETMVLIGPIDAHGWDGRIVNEEGTDLQQQAKIFYKLMKFFLDNNIHTFGLGGIEDESAWTNFVDMPDADPLLFSDIFEPKIAYYAIVQVLYEQLP